MVYKINAANFFDDDGELKSEALDKKMEELAVSYLSEKHIDIDVDYLWNDGTAEEIRDILQNSPDSDIYVDDYFQELIERMEK